MAASTDGRTGRRAERRRSPYPRVARINAQLVHVLGDALERMAGDDERLALLTVTGVLAAADLRHATVYFASLSLDAAAALQEHRVRLQAAIGTKVRMKRTPQLSFARDPAVAAGESVENAIRRLHETG
ncbi:MAG: ribosome-binding factor A [Acidimicrobiales bacterium]